MMQMMALPWAIPVVFGCSVGIVAILANMVSTITRSISNNGLKKRMIDQGFTADEIEQVVRAGSQRCPACGHDNHRQDAAARRAKPMKPPKHYSGV